MLVSDGTINGFDSSIIAFIQGLESPLLTVVMKFFTFIGSEIQVTLLTFIIAIFLYKRLRYRREAILFMWVMIGSTLLNLTLKTAFQRQRPEIHRIVEASGFSFPSGHSMAAFSLYGIIAFLLWRNAHHLFSRIGLIIVSVAMILVIGISRIYLGVHYPSDVLGGYFVSGFWFTASIWLYQFSLKKSTIAN